MPLLLRLTALAALMSLAACDGAAMMVPAM